MDVNPLPVYPSRCVPWECGVCILRGRCASGRTCSHRFSYSSSRSTSLGRLHACSRALRTRRAPCVATAAPPAMPPIMPPVRPDTVKSGMIIILLLLSWALQSRSRSRKYASKPSRSYTTLRNADSACARGGKEGRYEGETAQDTAKDKEATWLRMSLPRRQPRGCSAWGRRAWA